MNQDDKGTIITFFVILIATWKERHEFLPEYLNICKEFIILEWLGWFWRGVHLQKKKKEIKSLQILDFVSF